MAFEMTGAVTDYEGAAVAGAAVTVLLDLYSGPSVVTDATGRYTIRFTSAPGDAWPGGFRGAPGTEDAVAFGQVEASGYARHAHYVQSTAPNFVENFRVHRTTRITAGQSVPLTFGTEEGVCVVDVIPGRDQICRTMSVVAPADGIIIFEAVPTDIGAKRPALEVYSRTSSLGARGNPTSIPVTAGTECILDIALPWGTNESVVVNTSFTPSRLLATVQR